MEDLSDRARGINPVLDPVGFRRAWKDLSSHDRHAYIFPENLDYMDLSSLDLSGCDFSGRSCYSVNFSNSNLAGTNFSGSDLRVVKMHGAKYDAQTQFDKALKSASLLDDAHNIDGVEDAEPEQKADTPKEVYKPCLYCGHSKLSHQDYIDQPHPCAQCGCGRYSQKM